MNAETIARAAALVGFEYNDRNNDGSYLPVPVYTLRTEEGGARHYRENDPAIAHTLIFRLIERLNEAGCRVSQHDAGPEDHTTEVIHETTPGWWGQIQHSRGSLETRITTLCEAVEAIADA